VSEQTTGETLLIERDGQIATITINRPKSLNALNSQVLRELTPVLQRPVSPVLPQLVALADSAPSRQLAALLHRQR